MTTAEGDFTTRVADAIASFASGGDVRDLDPVFPEASRRADLALEGAASPDQIGYLASLLMVIGQQTDGVGAFGKVVDLVRGARQLPNADRPVELGLRTLLVAALTERCARQVSPPDENEVLTLTETLPPAQGVEAPLVIGMTNHRAAVLAGRYARRHELTDLTAAIALLRPLTAQVDDATQRAAVVNNLAVALNELAGRTGNRSVLDEAVDLTERATATLLDAATRGRVVDLLGIRTGVTRITLLARRWRMFAVSADLDAALDLVDDLAAVIATLPPATGHEERQGFHFSAGNLLDDVAAVIGDLEAADLAVEHLRTCVALAAPRGAETVAARSTLAVALAHRAELSDGPEQFADVDESIAMVRALLTDELPGDLLALHRHNLAIALVDRFVASDEGDPGDLDEAIALHELADAQLPPESPDRDIALMRRAMAHRIRHVAGNAHPDDVALPHALLDEATRLPGVTLRRIEAARLLAEISALTQDWTGARRAADSALRGVESVMGAVDDLRWDIWLRMTQGIGALGAYAAAATGDRVAAVEFLERGCGVATAARLAQQRSSLDAARAAGHEALVRAYEIAAARVRDVLAQADSSAVLVAGADHADTVSRDAVEHLVAARTALERAVPGLRSHAAVPDLLGFVARTGEPLTYLAATPVGGLRVDLVPRSGAAPSIGFTTLPDLDSDTVLDLAVRLHAADDDAQPPVGRPHRGSAVTPTGAEVTEVIEHLRAAVLTASPAPTRIVAGGAVGLLPVSAIWNDRDAVPVVRPVAGSGLLHLTSFANAARHGDRRLDSGTVVAVTDPAPCHWLDGPMPPLPAAVEEGEHIARLARGRHITGADATSRVLRETLADAGNDVVHIAAHGWTDQDDVDDVRLLLVDGEDGFSEYVTAQDIESGVECRGVFLACCWLARTGFRLPDEAMGFPTRLVQGGTSWVVAPLWPVDDRTASEVVRAFYDGLVGRGLAPRAALGAARDHVLRLAADDPFLGPAMRAEIAATAQAFVLIGS